VYPTNLMTEPKKLGPQWEIILIHDSKYGNKYKYQTYENERNQSSQVFEMILIENPEGLRVAQWKNVSLENAMNLDYQLSKDPVYGLWKAKAIFNGKDEVAQ